MDVSFDTIKNISRMLNLFENDSGSAETEYRPIYLYADGNNGRKQVTLARGFTQDGGNLWKVIKRYIERGGAKAEFFKPYETKMRDGNLWQDKAFLTALRDASSEQAMKDAQDQIFAEAYLAPALRWAESEGFTQPLSFAVTSDSYLHSGRMTPALIRKFAVKTPANGGDEKRWMRAYLEARLEWFRRSTGPLKTCQFRPQFFLGEIDKGNWSFDCPLVVKGKGRIC